MTTATHVSLRATAIEPTLIRALRDQAGPQSLDLGLGQTDLPISMEVRAALQAHLLEGRAPYSPNLGLAATREAVARHYGVDLQEVMITCGVQEGLAVAILGMVNPGDEVLVPDPGFPAYANLVRAAGATPVHYQLRAGNPGFGLDPQAVHDVLTDRTRAIVLNSPSNPTGAVTAREDLEAVLSLTTPRDITWISDEIYEDYVYDGAHCSPLDLDDHKHMGVKLAGLSKSHHLMGWRLGWLIGTAATVKALTPLHQHLVTCAPTPAQYAAVAALENHQRDVATTMRVFKSRRELAVQACQTFPGVDFAIPQGAFYLFVDVRAFRQTVGSSLDIAQAILREADVVTIPGSGFGPSGEGYLRLAYTIDEDRLRVAFDRLKTTLERWTRDVR